jgi:hypothetical protein
MILGKNWLSIDLLPKTLPITTLMIVVARSALMDHSLDNNLQSLYTKNQFKRLNDFQACVSI